MGVLRHVARVMAGWLPRDIGRAGFWCSTLGRGVRAAGAAAWGVSTEARRVLRTPYWLWTPLVLKRMRCGGYQLGWCRGGLAGVLEACQWRRL